MTFATAIVGCLAHVPWNFYIHKLKDLLLTEVLFCCQLRRAVGAGANVGLHQRKVACSDVWVSSFTYQSSGELQPFTLSWMPVNLFSTWPREHYSSRSPWGPKVTPALSLVLPLRQGGRDLPSSPCLEVSTTPLLPRHRSTMVIDRSSSYVRRP